jgi:hypothetical protein
VRDRRSAAAHARREQAAHKTAPPRAAVGVSAASDALQLPLPAPFGSKQRSKTHLEAAEGVAALLEALDHLANQTALDAVL